ncbi:polysaccharide deacetylase family protein [Ornithinibacillus halophilus]|uniref:Peptidoglycan/xylan/chitin deacetylase, PgdA/CDA1 family n=1 Tax=Ornithinibacillus halophilus TaxID=930117 RepID=A0A1M5C0S0_9BACI|nr:polysaccharide deacetylase family protein [Ornithinibacillus halophilus]SHF48260.1 Peptidoglycan/xylan/chitin deacetylase, PgdA/CDA1 family [Ornithinibacillus halophilus]
MKKIIMIGMFLIFTSIIASCSETEKSEENTNNENINTEEDSNEANENSVNEIEENNENDNNDTDNESSIEEEEQEEVIEPKYYISENWSVTPIDDSANENVVLLTIDDAPDQHAVDMAKTLKELDASAIFFVNGHFLDTPEEREALKEIHEMGFPIGNHTYSHINLSTISEGDEAKHIEEIVELNDLIEEIIGERPKFFRAPHGVNTDYSKELVKQEGMVLMNWTYGYDYFKPYMDADKLAEAMITGEGPEVDVPYSLLKPGANLLMHDREWTAEALDDIVIGLREQGYEIVDPALIQTIE